MKTRRQRFTRSGGFVLLLSLAALAQSGAQTCVQAPSGLVSWWPEDRTADDIADSNDGTLAGGATFASGRVGQAFSLDGAGASVNIANAPNLDVGNHVTIDLWIKGDPSNAMDTCCQGLITTDFYGIE